MQAFFKNFFHLAEYGAEDPSFQPPADSGNHKKWSESMLRRTEKHGKNREISGEMVKIWGKACDLLVN